jgi:hypothetical protein
VNRVPWRLTLTGLAALAALLIALGMTNLVPASRYQAITSGVQAVGVIIALGLGVATLRGDSKDRRVDRVLALQQELVSGELQAARGRLIRHLRRHGANGKLLTVSGFDLDDQTSLGRYSDDPDARPRGDLNLLLRYFERANALRSAKAVDLPLFADLVGGHALWWDTAVKPEPDWPTRQHLTELGTWVRIYFHDHQSRNPLLQRWTNNIERDFEVGQPP